jgi:hypothetical protein
VSFKQLLLLFSGKLAEAIEKVKKNLSFHVISCDNKHNLVISSEIISPCTLRRDMLKAAPLYRASI